MYQLSYVKISSANQNANLLLLDDPSRVRSQITSGLCMSFRKHLFCVPVLCTGCTLKKGPYASSPGRYKSEPGPYRLRRAR